MRKRNVQILHRLTKDEQEKLDNHVSSSSLPRQAYIRFLLNGYIPRPLPPLEYHTLIRELHAIGNNMNQLATKANATGHIDTTVFQYEANRLRRAVQEIQEAFTAPERRDELGHDSYLGRKGPP
jgi:hypothetical protein